MNLTLLNSLLQIIEIIDTFSSLIWTDRYDEFGDFELHLPITEENLLIFQKGYFLTLDASDHVMIIETVEIKSDVDEGDSLIVQGRSIESITDRRIVWDQTLLSGNLQSEVHRLLNENVISPSLSARTIPNFIFQTSSDTNITSLTVEAQYTGDLLYVVIAAICKANNLGFKITLNSSNQFVFALYSGVDRSYAQITNPYVVFSPSFENVVNSNYFTSDVTLKNVALVAGEGEGTDRLTIQVGTGSGLARREQYVDARDLSKTTDSGVLPDADYLDQLSQRGEEKLAESIAINHFEGEIDSSNMYVYGVHFYTGDIVQFANQYGQQGRSRVTELIISQSTTGINIHPTFQSLD